MATRIIPHRFSNLNTTHSRVLRLYYFYGLYLA